MDAPSACWASQHDDQRLLVDYADRSQNLKTDRIKLHTKEIPLRLRNQKRNSWLSLQKTLREAECKRRRSKWSSAFPIGQQEATQIVERNCNRIDTRAFGKQNKVRPNQKLLSIQRENSSEPPKVQNSNSFSVASLDSTSIRVKLPMASTTLEASNFLPTSKPLVTSLHEENGFDDIASKLFFSTSADMETTGEARSTYSLLSHDVFDRYCTHTAEGVCAEYPSNEFLTAPNNAAEGRTSFDVQIEDEFASTVNFQTEISNRLGSCVTHPVDLTQNSDVEDDFDFDIGLFKGGRGLLQTDGPEEGKLKKIGRKKSVKQGVQENWAKNGPKQLRVEQKREEEKHIQKGKFIVATNKEQERPIQEAHGLSQEQLQDKQKCWSLQTSVKEPSRIHSATGLAEITWQNKPVENSSALPKEQTRTEEAFGFGAIGISAQRGRDDARPTRVVQDMENMALNHRLNEEMVNKPFLQADISSDDDADQKHKVSYPFCKDSEDDDLINRNSRGFLMLRGHGQILKNCDAHSDWEEEIELPVIQEEAGKKEAAQVRGLNNDLRDIQKHADIGDRVQVNPCNTHANKVASNRAKEVRDSSSADHREFFLNGSHKGVSKDRLGIETHIRADGLGNVSYYPQFPGAKTSNRFLFKSKKDDGSASRTAQFDTAVNNCAPKSKANQVTVSGWDICQGIIPKECFSAATYAKETIQGMKNPIMSVNEEKGQAEQGLKEDLEEMERARRKTEENMPQWPKDMEREDKVPEPGHRLQKLAQHGQVYGRDAEDLEDRRILKAHREREEGARQRKATQGAHTNSWSQCTKSSSLFRRGRQSGVKAGGSHINYSPFAHVRTPRGEEAEPDVQQKRAQALFQWRKSGMTYAEIRKRWCQLTGRVKSGHALRSYYDRLCETIEGPNELQKQPKRDIGQVHNSQGFDDEQVILGQAPNPIKRVRFDERPRIREYYPDKSSEDAENLTLHGPPILEPQAPRQSPYRGGGKDMELVEKLYKERQSNNFSEEKDETESISEEEGLEVATKREESPITEADLTHWTYGVYRKGWTSDEDEDEDEVPWVQCGDVYSSLHVANMSAGREVLQQRDSPHPMFPNPEEFRVSKDEHGLQNYFVETEGFCVKVRVGRILRTTRDGISPKTKTGWLKKVVYEVKYETGEILHEGGAKVKSLPELFTILEQANQEAATQLIDLSVPAKSQKVDEVQKRIAIQKQLDDYIAGLDGNMDLFSVEGDEDTGVKVWIEERFLRGPRNI